MSCETPDPRGPDHRTASHSPSRGTVGSTLHERRRRSRLMARPRCDRDVRVLVDADPLACATLRTNPKHHSGVVLERDVATLSGGELRRVAGLGKKEPLLVLGGPPCQPFSKASYWTHSGEEAAYRRARA